MSNLHVQTSGIEDAAATSRRFINPLNFKPPMARHQTYVETRGSTGAWMFRKPHSPVEVLNDSDGEAINLSRVMIHSETRARILDTYSSLVNARFVVPVGSGDPRIARAIRFGQELYRLTSAMSFKQRRRLPLEMPPQLRQLDQIMQRLRDVQIEDEPLVDLLHRYDWSRAFFLCDERETNWDIEAAEPIARKLISTKGKITLIVSARPAWIEGHQRWRRFDLSRMDVGNEEVWTNF